MDTFWQIIEVDCLVLFMYLGFDDFSNCEWCWIHLLVLLFDSAHLDGLHIQHYPHLIVNDSRNNANSQIFKQNS